MNKDTVKRVGRTFAQSFIGALALLLIPVLTDIMRQAGEAQGGLVDIDVSVLGNILIAACIAGIISVISFLQNLFEEKTGVDVLPK